MRHRRRRLAGRPSSSLLTSFRLPPSTCQCALVGQPYELLARQNWPPPGKGESELMVGVSRASFASGLQETPRDEGQSAPDYQRDSLADGSPGATQPPAQEAEQRRAPMMGRQTNRVYG